MSFSMLFYEQPRSNQSSNANRQRYIQRLQAEAIRRFAAQEMLGGSLYARIIWFYTQHSKELPDVDNIIKPILDALKGVVYIDDDAIVKCAAEKVDVITSGYDLVGGPKDHDLFEELVQTLGIPSPSLHVIYIEVGKMADRRVLFGPLDGGTT